MVEEKEQGLPSVYWICHKSQLIRCAPHHCRPDFHHLSQNIVDNLIEAKELLRSLKSRGVTRFLDLNKVNHQHIDDVEEDEQIFFDDDGESSAKRRRLDLALGPAPPSITYSPSVADTADLGDQEPHPLPHASPLGLMEQDPPQDAEPNLEEVDITDLLSGDEPLAEPDRPPTPAVPSSASATGLSGNSLTFLQQRQQHEQQEAQALFGPQRHQQRAHGSSPYVRGLPGTSLMPTWPFRSGMLMTHPFQVIGRSTTRLATLSGLDQRTFGLYKSSWMPDSTPCAQEDEPLRTLTHH